MNYQKAYDSLVQKNRTFSKGEYFETHHKVPKCMGGTDDANNLVNLTAREHYIAHLLLVKITEVGGNTQAHEKMLYAFNCMKWGRCEGERSFRFNSRLYQSLKEQYSKLRSKMMKTSHNPSKGKHWICNDDLKMTICIESNALYWDYLASGWRTGRRFSESALKRIFESNTSTKGRIWIRKKDLTLQMAASKENVQHLLNTGEWEYGRLHYDSDKLKAKQSLKNFWSEKTDELINRLLACGHFDISSYKGVVKRKQVRRFLIETGHNSCVKCGKENVKLTVHAKDGNCRNLSINNYEFLCRECYLDSGTAGFSGRHHK